VLDSVLDDLISGLPNDIAETSMIPALTNRAKVIISELLANGEYARAQQYEDVHTSLVELLSTRQTQEQKVTKLQTLQANIANLEEKVVKRRDNLGTILSNDQDEIDNAVAVENERWATESEGFDKVTNGPLPPGARKLSSRLLNLRAQERFLLSSRRYQEAAGMKNEADQLESQELEQLRTEFVRKREVQKAILRDVHEQKLKCILAKGNQRKDEITRSGKKEIKHLRQAIENMQGRIQQLELGDIQVPPRSERGDSTFLTQGETPASACRPCF
jgi:hypothetical protein